MRYPEAVQDIPQLRHIAGSLGVEYAYRPDRVDFPCRYGAGRDEKIEPVLSGRLPPVIQERQPQLGFALRQFRQSKFIWRNRLGQRCNLGNFRFAAGITCPIRQHDRELELQAGGLLRGAVYDRKIPPAGIAGEEVLWKEPVVRMQHRQQRLRPDRRDRIGLEPGRKSGITVVEPVERKNPFAEPGLRPGAESRRQRLFQRGAADEADPLRISPARRTARILHILIDIAGPESRFGLDSPAEADRFPADQGMCQTSPGIASVNFAFAVIVVISPVAPMHPRLVQRGVFVPVVHIGIELRIAEVVPLGSAGESAHRAVLPIVPPHEPDLPIHELLHFRAAEVGHFIAETPHHHRRMVAGGVQKFQQLREIVFFKLIIIENIGEAPGPFIVDHHAEFVGDFVTGRQQRHMRGAHDVVAFGFQLLQIVFDLARSILQVTRSTAVITGSDILAEKVNRLPVQQEFPVRNPEVAEAEPFRGAGERFSARVDPEGQKIKIRLIRRPAAGCVKRNLQTAGIPAGLQQQRQRRIFAGALLLVTANCGRNPSGQFCFHCFAGMVFELIKNGQAVGFQVGRQAKAADSDFRFKRQGDALP